MLRSLALLVSASALCVNHTVVSGDTCNSVASYFGSELEDISCIKGPSGQDCDPTFSCVHKLAQELYVSELLQICHCTEHCDETPAPTPAPPGPAPKDCSKTGSETNCKVLDTEAYCGISSNKDAVWTDGTGCSCDWGWKYDNETHHCKGGAPAPTPASNSTCHEKCAFESPTGAKGSPAPNGYCQEPISGICQYSQATTAGYQPADSFECPTTCEEVDPGTGKCWENPGSTAPPVNNKCYCKTSAGDPYTYCK